MFLLLLFGVSCWLRVVIAMSALPGTKCISPEPDAEMCHVILDRSPRQPEVTV